MQPQFNGGTVKEQQIKALIVQYEDSIRLQKKLLDCHLAETLFSVIPMCMNNQETLETRLQEKTIECKRLKLSLDYARDRVAILNTQSNKNTAIQEFLDFAAAHSEFRDSNDDISSTSNTEKEKSFQHIGISSNMCCAKKLKKDEDELNGGKLESDEVTDKDTCSILPSNIINEDLLTLNSKLELAQESLSQLQYERDSLDHLSDKLCDLLFEYHKRIGLTTEKRKNEGQTSNYSDHPSINAASDSSVIIRRVTLQSAKRSLDQLKYERDSSNELADKLCNLLFQYQKRRIPAKKSKKRSRTSKNDDDGTVLSDIEHSFGKLALAPAQNFQKNCSPKKDIDSVSMVSKTSDGNSDKSFRKPIRAVRLTNENVKYDNISHEIFKKEVLNFRCNSCDLTFSGSHNLKTHIRRLHEKEGLYKCFVCKKKFFCNRDLKKHTLIHGSGKPFKCLNCHKRFTKLSSKQKHQRVGH